MRSPEEGGRGVRPGPGRRGVWGQEIRYVGGGGVGGGAPVGVEIQRGHLRGGGGGGEKGGGVVGGGVRREVETER